MLTSCTWQSCGGEGEWWGLRRRGWMMAARGVMGVDGVGWLVGVDGVGCDGKGV